MPDDAASADSPQLSPELYERMFEHAREGMTLVERGDDGAFRYRAANPAMAELLGVDRADLVGQTPHDVFESAEARRLGSLYARFETPEDADEVTHEFGGPEDRVVLRSRFQPLVVDGRRRGLLVVSSDITELERTRKALGRDRRALRELYNVAGGSDLDLPERLRSLLSVGARRLQLPIGFLTEIENDVQEVLHSFGDHDQLQTGQSAPLDETFCRKTVASPDGLVTIQTSVADELTDDPAYERFGLGCYIGARIVARGELIGTLCFAAREPRPRSFTDDDRTFVRLLAQWASRELERQELLRHLTP